ncbi:MAG: redox-regulated ATPase YchF [Oligoflexia bacterium]|nr:redox-regulated ATPase YchF [Oligoflexia bacterium]
MKIAILGLPGAGKKTIFKLLTGRESPVSGQRRLNEVVTGIAPVRDPRVDKIVEMVHPQKITYAQTEFVLCNDIDDTNSTNNTSDLGNWFAEGRLADLLFVVVRDFAAEEVYHPAGSVNAARDKENITTELILKDLELLEKRLERMAKDRVKNRPTPQQQLEEQVLSKCRPFLEDSKCLRTVEMTSEEKSAISSLNFLTRKPILWCYNIDETKVKLFSATERDANEFHISAKIEQEIMEIADSNERSIYLQEVGITTPGIDRLNALAYDLLGLMSFYTMGKDEARAWTIRKGTPAPKAAGKIHSDLERGFIRVEITKYDDLLKYGGEQQIKAAGKAMVKGHDYIIADGDICNFLFKV